MTTGFDMKKIFFATMLVCLSLSSGAYTFEDLEGSYDVSITSTEVSYFIEIDAEGYTHISGEGLWCDGYSTLDNDVVFTEFECDLGPFFNHSFDLSKITSLEDFNAPITSEILEQVEVGHFIKIE